MIICAIQPSEPCKSAVSPSAHLPPDINGLRKILYPGLHSHLCTNLDHTSGGYLEKIRGITG